jgi:hypothetical protein
MSKQDKLLRELLCNHQPVIIYIDNSLLQVEFRVIEFEPEPDRMWKVFFESIWEGQE